METAEDLQALLDSDEYSFRFDIGVSIPSSTALVNKEGIALSIAMHYLVYRCKAELDQIKDGLRSLEILDLMAQHPTLMRPLFLESGKPKLSAESFLQIFNILWSPVGSNRREQEEAVIYGWTEYVHEIEGEIVKS